VIENPSEENVPLCSRRRSTSAEVYDPRWIRKDDDNVSLVRQFLNRFISLSVDNTLVRLSHTTLLPLRLQCKQLAAEATDV